MHRFLVFANFPDFKFLLCILLDRVVLMPNLRENALIHCFLKRREECGILRHTMDA